MMAPNPTAPLLHALVGDEEVSACFSNEADLAAMLRFEAALAQSQAECGLIDPAAAEAIPKACGSFKPDWQKLAAGIAQDGVVVPALVKQLRASMNEPHRNALHFGATSQDVIDTSLIAAAEGRHRTSFSSVSIA